ncbi:MAG: Fur family transcriptional regulator [Acidimicrobiia bacterium]|nr:Fur family transcriptional regulator [Acidimicrobiia bacterium]
MARPTAGDLVGGLRTAGLRITDARRRVCGVLAGAADAEHLTAADVAERAGRIDLSTVYRTLDALEGEGLVTHVHLGHGAGAYHVAPSEDHHHLVCTVCGATVDVPIGEMGDAVAALTEPHGFVADTAHFAIVGRCAGCAA